MWPRNDGERAMEYYVGLDVSLKQTSICVWIRRGRSCERAWSIQILRRSQFT